MAFQSNNYGNNNQQGGGSGKPKSNFRIGRIIGGDGRLDVTMWNSQQGGWKCVMTIYSKIGEDPNTKAPSYENKAPNELPGVYLNPTHVRALMEYLENKDFSQSGGAMTVGKSKFIFGVKDGNPTFGISTDGKGERTMTVLPIEIGDKKISAEIGRFKDLLSICYQKGLRGRLDPDEFGSKDTDGDGGDTDGFPF
jgi:hypothetical protein